MNLRIKLTRLFSGRFGSAIRSVVRRSCGRMKFRRSLPAKFDRTPLYVSPAATLEYLLPGKHCFDPELLWVAENCVKKTDIVWDVGANLGVFTLAAAHKTPQGQVLAFEADPWLASMIRDSLLLKPNRHYKTGVVCGAIGPEANVNSFCVARCGRASSYLKEYDGRSMTGGVEYELEVFTLPLDIVAEQMPPPDFLKIDVEGAEVSVLQGAKKLIHDFKPDFYIEVGELSKEQTTEILTTAGYKLFDVSSGNLEEIDNCCTNTLAIHQSKLKNRLFS